MRFMDSVISKYINRMCEMQEDDFTKEIIKPLFESMGYDSVDFNGGSYERGRDLIAKRRIPPKREMYVVYVQSKKLGDSQKVSDAAKISTLLHQLRQCCKKGVTDYEGNEVYPSEVYLACPNIIKNRFMEELEEQFFDDSMKIIPYDGGQIISHIKEFNPKLLEKLGSVESRLTDRPEFALVNSELLSALKSHNCSELSDFYSDLSFFVGAFDSNLLLHLDIKFQGEKVEFSEDEWSRAFPEVVGLQSIHSLSLFSESLEQIVKKYKKDKQLYESEANLLKIAERKRVEETYNEYEIKVKKSLDDLAARLARFDSVPKEKLGEEEVKAKEVYSLMRALVADFSSDKVPEINAVDDQRFYKFYAEAKELASLLKFRKSFQEKLEVLSKEIANEPFYIADVNSYAIKEKVDSYKKNYFSSVDKINAGELGGVELKNFLKETEKALSLIDKLRDSRFFMSRVVRFGGDKKYQERVSISPMDIFATGHDIAVYGGAGVGKTTTLYAYAEMQYRNGADDLILVPLNKLVDKYKEIQRDTDGEDFFKDSLLEKLVLMSKGIFPSAENVEEAREVLLSNITLILDGLDEVYSAIPDIVPAISDFKKKNPGAQLIISSRDCVSYLNDIEFLGITLLPFTEEQLKKFIVGWLKDSSKSNALVGAIEKRELYQHINTPLLATITCSLVERGVSVPATEYEIYAERLRLLTGEYDTHKKIERQKIKGDLLRKCAVKIAFYFHEQGVRSVGKEKIIKLLLHSFGENYTKDLLMLSFEELVDPCGVMAVEPLTNTYTFGHFRFQEYLASEELRVNRGVDLAEFVCKDWWRGALCLYAQQAGDISFLIEDVYRKFGSVSKAEMTLREMINNGSKSKRSSFLQLLDDYQKSDSLDEMLLGEDHFDF